MKLSAENFKELKDNLRFEKVFNLNSIQLTLRASNPELLKQFVSEFTKALKETHDLSMNPRLTNLKKRIEALNQSADLAKSLNNKALSKLQTTKSENDLLLLITSQNLLTTTLINQNLIELEEVSDPSITYPTSTANLYIDPSPSRPNSKLILLLFIFLGLMNGLILAYSHKTYTDRV